MNAVVIFFEKNKEVPGSYSTQNQRVRPASIMFVDSNEQKHGPNLSEFLSFGTDIWFASSEISTCTARQLNRRTGMLN